MEDKPLIVLPENLKQALIGLNEITKNIAEVTGRTKEEVKEMSINDIWVDLGIILNSIVRQQASN